jgi:hypothetical protein
MFNLVPADPSVVADGTTGRPLQIRVTGRRLAVTHVRSVRDETAAYPASTGPRTVFVVEASGRRFRLIHQLRDRRWLVDELEPGQAVLSPAA